MSNSSQQTDYLTILNSSTGYSNGDTITISGINDSCMTSSGDTVVLNMNDITIDSYAASMTVPTVSTVNTSGIDSFTLDNSSMDWFINQSEEWVDSFPNWGRVQDMCKKYPGLEIALRNFQTVYTLVKDDYDNATDQE